ncbi:GAP family protein [Synechococcus sp. FACHB-909]|uniref:GAP family protein n=1 Tax=Synechococcus sp. FACHB-909 TaxID=2692863 RepID=UPI00168745F5|nr:GAP family protein [Synechococcus sp. FACHB-909]MBD2719999.1 GAP family protein [Synechococcus sp. FACHB-909]
MTIERLAPLVALALIDSTSFGTLLIPLWLMLVPGRPRPGRIVLFLGTVAAFYLLLGMALLLGASMLLDMLQQAGDSQPLRVAQLGAGIGLMALGARMEPWTRAGKERRAARRAAKKSRNGPSLFVRMRRYATDPSAPVGAVIVFALTAAVIEAASMIPYLAAIGLLTASELSLLGRSAVLFGYCLVMITPALLLLVARLFLHDHVSPFLKKLESLLSRHANESVAWVVFLVGLYLAGDSLTRLVRW